MSKTYEEVEVDDFGATRVLMKKADRLHHTSRPSSLKYWKGGEVKWSVWYRDGETHRDDGPAWVQYHRNGNLSSQIWFRNGSLHREGGHASITYCGEGSISRESWYKDGKLHRGNGPAEIYYYREYVFPHDHRTFAELDRDGAVCSAHWYRNGEQIC